MSKKEPAYKATVQDLMITDVITVSPQTTMEELRKTLVEEGISAAPVLEGEELVGIVTSTDLLRTPEPAVKVAEVMADQLYTVPPYADLHLAARIMRNHGLHHVLVVHEQKLQGILASYDLLALVEQHRFTMKTKPTPPKRRKGGRRRKLERELAKARREAAQAPESAPPPEVLQRERLNALLGHLTRRQAKVEGDRQRRHGLEQDFAEQAVVRENDEVLDALSQEGEDQLALVSRALERLDEGSYGSCEDCSQGIGKARLEALPYATTCIDCARKREQAVV